MPAPNLAGDPLKKCLFAVRNTLPPPWHAAGARGRGGWVAGGWWLGWLGWLAGWLVAGGLVGWVGWVEVIGFDIH